MCWQGYGIGDHFRDGAYGGSKDTGAVLEKAVTQLGLQPHTIEQTVRLVDLWPAKRSTLSALI